MVYLRAQFLGPFSLCYTHMISVLLPQFQDCYANDTQIYACCRSPEPEYADLKGKVLSCIFMDTIANWMTIYERRLNKSKSEFLRDATIRRRRRECKEDFMRADGKVQLVWNVEENCSLADGEVQPVGNLDDQHRIRRPTYSRATL